MTGTGKLGQLVPKDPWPYVNHYSFHILDPDWGHLTIKMSGHPPFGAQVMLNGHEYVALSGAKSRSEHSPNRKLLHYRQPTPQIWRKSQIPCPRKRLQGACANSASVGFIAPVCVLLSTWRSRKGAPFTTSTRCFRWSTAGICCSAPAGRWTQIFQALIDRTRAPLDLDRIKTIFGDKKRPHYDKRKRIPRDGESWSRHLRMI